MKPKTKENKPGQYFCRRTFSWYPQDQMEDNLLYSLREPKPKPKAKAKAKTSDITTKKAKRTTDDTSRN